jgi:hypothetical protein
MATQAAFKSINRVAAFVGRLEDTFAGIHQCFLVTHDANPMLTGILWVLAHMMKRKQKGLRPGEACIKDDGSHAPDDQDTLQVHGSLGLSPPGKAHMMFATTNPGHISTCLAG